MRHVDYPLVRFFAPLKLTALLMVLLCCGVLRAQEMRVGEVLRIATREAVSVPVYAFWQPHAIATVILYSGGGGGYGNIGEDGWPAGGNFLILTGKRWAHHPFNVVMVGRPTDGIDLSQGNVRTGTQHAADNAAIFRAIKRRSPQPLWVIGTSMGTISATAAAIQDNENLIAGLVLTSSIVAYKISGAVPRQNLEIIRVPTLIVHHAEDECWACRAYEAKNIAPQLENAPIVKTIFVNGGADASGDPCEPMHYHGFVGMRDTVVDLIATWIIKPIP